jgi:hypothetical protein
MGWATGTLSFGNSQTVSSDINLIYNHPQPTHDKNNMAFG